MPLHHSVHRSWAGGQKCGALQVYSSVALLCSLAGVLRCTAVEPCSPETETGKMRDQMLHRFHSHFTDFEKGLFEKPRRRQPGDQLVMISKEDYYCGGNAVPSFYIEFIVHGARPVDVFNTISDTASQPKWLCTGCNIELVRDDLEQRVQGFAATYPTPMMNRREFYQWQAYEANFSGQEFVVGATARNNEVLHRARKPEVDATIGRMCYAFSRIMPHPEGTRVIQMNHFDARMPFEGGLFSLRHLYHLVWPSFLHRVPKIIAQSKLQAKLNWDPHRVIVPEVFIGIGSGSSPAARVAARNAVKNEASGGGYLVDDERPAVWPMYMAMALMVVVLMVCIMYCFCGDKQWCRVHSLDDESAEYEDDSQAEDAEEAEETEEAE